MKGSSMCWFHDKSIPEERRKIARSAGGKSNTHKHTNEVIISEVKSSQDIPILLRDTIKNVLLGKIEIRIANCVGYLAGHLLRAYEVSDQEIRLNAIEKQLNTIKNN